MHLPRLRRTASAASLLLLLSAGCYHYRVAAPAFDPATEPQRAVVHSLAWGLVNKPVTTLARNCANSNALDQVRVSSNLGYTLVTVLTLGFWAPVEVEWQCAKRREEPGDIGGAVAVTPQEGKP